MFSEKLPADIANEEAIKMSSQVQRRQLLKSLTGGLLAGALGSGSSPRRSLAADTGIELWLQSQYWSDEFVAACEKATGVRVHNTSAISNPSTFSKLIANRGRDVDVIQIQNAFVPALVEEGILQPFDMSQIPNAKFMYPTFEKPAGIIGKDGKQYGVPFSWGYDTLLYNADVIAEADSLGILFDERYKGRISLRDDAFSGFSTAALFFGKKDPYNLTDSDLDELKKFLISKKPIFRTFWSTFAEAVTFMKNKDIWATSAWLPIYWVLKQTEHMNVRFPIPREGAQGFVLCFLMSKESRNPEAVHRFVNWMLSAEWAAPIARTKGYYSTAKLGLPEIPADVRQALNYDNIEQQMEKLRWSSFPKNLSNWTEAWTEFKAA